MVKSFGRNSSLESLSLAYAREMEAERAEDYRLIAPAAPETLTLTCQEQRVWRCGRVCRGQVAQHTRRAHEPRYLVRARRTGGRAAECSARATRAAALQRRG